MLAPPLPHTPSNSHFVRRVKLRLAYRLAFVKSNHLANGVGSDGSELCSVTLITLSHITKSADRLHTSPWDIAGTVGNVRKCRIVSTLWMPYVRKSQLCFHIFHLTHCDSQASFFATLIWNEINLNNKCVQESFSSMCARYFVRSLLFLSQELAAPAGLGPCSVTSFSATPCLGKSVLIKAVDWKVEYL